MEFGDKGFMDGNFSRAVFEGNRLWAKGDCWHGGGLFIDNSRYCLNDFCDSQQVLKEPRGLKRNLDWPFPGGVGAECLGVYFPRLLRDGWQLTSESRRSENSISDEWVFEKPALGGWSLRKHAFATLDHPPGKGCYFDRHELLHKSSGARIDGWDWEWAEVDRQRIAWSEAGKLLAAELTPAGLANLREIYDFNSLKFEAKVAPY